MDTEVNDYLKFLSQNVAELKQLGKEWGMSDREISSCIDRALEDTIESPSVGLFKSSGRKIWSFIRLSLKIWFSLVVCLIVLSSGTYYFLQVSDDASTYVGRVLQPYGYEIFRTIRLVTLPIHDYLSVSQYYDAECIIGNPYYKEPVMDCRYCLDMDENGIHIMEKTNQSLLESLWDKHVPVCIKAAHSNNVTYDDLHQLYVDNKDTLEEDYQSVESTQTFVNSLQDLFGDKAMKEKITKTDNTVIKWNARGVKTSRVLRMLFPRLSFVPLASEIGLEKTLYIDGPSSEHYDIAESVLPLSFYIQGSGQRKAVVMPAPSCQKQCDVMSVFMKGGDVLVFHASYWKVYLLPNLRGISVGFAGSFSYLDKETPVSDSMEKIYDPEIYQGFPDSTDDEQIMYGSDSKQENIEGKLEKEEPVETQSTEHQTASVKEKVKHKED